MAVPPKTNAGSNVFMREVDDALRQDKAEAFLRNYGKPLLAAIVLGLAGLGGFLYWEHRQSAEAEAGAEQLVLSFDDLEAGSLPKAGGRLAPIAAETGGTAVLARLTQAGIALEKGDAEGAAKLYAQVARDEDVPQPLRDLATVREVAAGFDKLPVQTVIDRLTPLAQPGNPWSGVAGEMLGVAYIEQGKTKQAGPILVRIAKDKTQPEGLRQRVRQLAGQLGYDAIDDVVTLNSENGAGPGAGGE